MEESAQVTRRRLGQAMRRAKAAVHPASVPVGLLAAHVGGEPIPYTEAITRPFEPFAVGDLWGPAWDSTWFRLQGTVPDKWASRPVDVRVDLGFRDVDAGGAGGFGAEAMVYEAGEPIAAFTGRHLAIRLTPSARGGDEVDWYLDAAANPMVAAFMGTGAGAPWTAVDVRGPPLFRVQQADLAVVDPEVEARFFDLSLAMDLLDALPAGQPRHAELLGALLAWFDRRDPDPLKAALAHGTSSRHHVSAIGHAHIDTAWLWPLREAERKVARTWASAARLAEEYPEYRFCASAPLHWDWVRRAHAGLFERLRAAVERGQIEPVGAMWVEPDCNVPSGEALVRQITRGWRWFRDHLGVEVDGIFLPDVFGYPAQLPQLAAQAGLTWFCTQKISWNRVNRFPHHSFWWEGLDGTRLFTHFPPADTYNAELTAPQLLRHLTAFANHDWATRSLVLYGYGDGGGGPTRALLERARRVADIDGLPPVRQERVTEFFAAARAEAVAAGDRAPVWVGELYLEMHRGTYTTQAATKAGNRRAQEGLREAELWWAVRAAEEGWGGWPAAALDAAWDEMLMLQFHDILPGSSIGWVYDDAARSYARIDASIATMVAAALAGDTDVVVNPTGRWRAGMVDGRWVTAPPFSAVPLADAEQVPTGEVRVGESWARPERPREHRRGTRSADRGLSGNGWVENGVVRVEWCAETGVLTSVRDVTAAREVLAGEANVLQLFDDRPVEYDAWDIDAHTLAHPVPWTAADSVTATEDGVEVRRTSPSAASTIVQRVRLQPGSRRIDVECDVDWHEDRTLLKVAFPVAVRSPRATFEVQYGAVERPTHRNTSWDAARFEVPAQRWADLSEAGYGVALLNDCKHGYDVAANVLRLTLLRSPVSPDPVADRGRHRFTYALLPHSGMWQTGGVVEAAEDLNRPLRIVSAGRPAPSLLWLDAPGAVVDCVKKVDAGGGWIVRLYEAWGGRWEGNLLTRLPVSRAERVDLLERPLADEPCADGAVPLVLDPFEIRTLLLR